MATKPQFEQDAQKMASGNLVSYVTSLRGLYKDKPRKEAPAAPAPSAPAEKKKTKPILGGSNPDMDDEVRDNL